MKGIEDLISDELQLDPSAEARQGQTRSETRRAVEDLLEVRRYKKMLDDYYDID